ncbi:MAG: hypothetical protein QMD23_03370 [Candidatus Bathyarchaeia archaeon]|nr:hypothetical protein [Candidatus Bathyarchaeia archaeon]
MRKKEDPTPRKALKKMVYQRDKGKCRVCGVKVDPFNFEICVMLKFYQ